MPLQHAKFTPRLSSARGHADHGWLNTYHTFSFSSYYDPAHMSFGSLRVLNEDRVAAHNGFPTHPHRDAEIFSYILSGELTHRDSMGGSGKDDFYRMKRGDVQFTTGGTGIAHSEQNESNDQVHFLQIWALPWKKGLTPRYHTKTFDESQKRAAFVPILSPLKAGPQANAQEEKAAEASLEGTIPIHADLVMGAAVLEQGVTRDWGIGGSAYQSNGVVRKLRGRKAYLHLAMTGGGKSKVMIDGRQELKEGDGCYIDGVNVGDILKIESTGSADADVVILDVD